MPLDFYLFRVIHNLAGKLNLLDWLGVFLANNFGYFLVIVFLYLLLREKNWRKRIYFLSLTVLSTILSRGIITEVIRFFFNRPRPFYTLNFIPLIAEATGGSFPSGHATFFFALAFSVYYFLRPELKLEDKKWLYIIFWGTLAMCLARIYVGVHWPSDILGGFIIGWLSAFFVVKLLPPPSNSAPNS